MNEKIKRMDTAAQLLIYPIVLSGQKMFFTCFYLYKL